MELAVLTWKVSNTWLEVLEKYKSDRTLYYTSRGYSWKWREIFATWQVQEISSRLFAARGPLLVPQMLYTHALK